ncbi:MAG: fluoride efflux transporter CrcB [Woeseiaceae bacterium]
MISFLLVGAGGAVGAMFRYGLVGFVQSRIPFSTFPYGTLTVNLCGCLLIGALTGLVDARQLFTPEFRTFALIGVLGGFTTYSTFGYETFALLRDAEFPRALAYVGVHVIAGLALVWAGYNLTTSKWT